tara:strand:- start:2156 stop:2812 length:657 start_codon:yes stop_codon:yes gene_type:complete
VHRRYLYIKILLIIISCNNKVEPILPYYNSANFEPIFIKDKNIVENKIDHKISDFKFINQDNNEITENDISGKIHVANFIFTSCINICPSMTENMKIINNNFKNNPNVMILSYSVMPWIDDTNKLKKFKDFNKIKSTNWHFLTGKKDEIYSLARNSYFVEEELGFNRDSSDFLHTEHFILVDQNKRLRGIYNGTLKLEAKQVVDDINLLLEYENWDNI